MKDLIFNGTIQYNILNASENNSPTSHKNSISRIKTKDSSSCSSYLQKLCEVVKHEEKIKSPGSSAGYEISPLEIKESLLNAFNFLKRSSEPKVNNSKPAHRHIMVGNCLTVYSNLDVAPLQKPFKKTSSEDLPVYIKSIINTDPSLSHLLKYGCISISPVKDTDDLPKGSKELLGGDCSPSDLMKKGCAEKLLRLKKEATNDALKDVIDDIKLDVKRIFPEVFCAATVNQKTKSKRAQVACSSYSSGTGLSNEAEFSSNSNEESHYEGNINPSDVLEVCIQEEDSKSALYAANNASDCECKICRKCFATPIEMYFHVLSHSKNSYSKHDEFSSSGYHCRLTGFRDIEVTTPRKTFYKGGFRRNQKLKSILKDINYNQDVLADDHMEAEIQPNTLNFHSPQEFVSIFNKRSKKQNCLRSKKLPKYCDVQNSTEIRNKLVSKSSYRLQLNRNIKGRVNKAVHILCRRNSLNNK